MSIDKAYASSGKIFEQVSKLHSPGMLEQLRQTGKEDIVVVRGTYDHIEKLLDTIKVPYTLIGHDDIASHNGGRVMFANCMAYNEISVPKKAVQQFVREGGRLVTTDWSLGLVTHTFPNRLKKVKETVDDVVEIQCFTDIGRRFIGLNYSQCHPQWWLETSSHIYDLGQGVIPIITSKEMEDKYGKPYVAVGFNEGDGEVFHFISHFELQRTRQSGKAGKAVKESLDDFLKKMKVEKTPDMEDATLVELEAAYSTLNTLAYLCLPSPILLTDMKSITTFGDSPSGAGKSDKGSKSSSLKSKSLVA